jgi:general secretion pathway protein F
MTQEFSIRYFDPSSRTVVQELVVTDSASQLQSEFEAAGRVVLELRRHGKAMFESRGGKTEFNVGWWCRELRTLLKAGMTVVEALETLQVQSRGGRREQVHANLLRSLREGQSLSKAMAGAGVFPEVLVASVTASERTSTLSSALEDFLHYDEMLQRLRRQVVSAAIYPAVVMALGVLITTFLLMYVIPRFSRMYVSYHGAVSLPTQTLLGVSRLLHEHWLVVLFTLACISLSLVWAVNRGHALRFLVSVLQTIGPLNRQWDHFRRAKLYQSMALMFRGGYTLDEALTVCETLGLGNLTTVGISVARAELARGRSVAQSFTQGGLTDAVSERLLAVGERTGGFDAVLQTIADRHAERFATFIERATRIIEPLLLLVVALGVGGVVVMMYMPIFDIANGIR